MPDPIIGLTLGGNAWVPQFVVKLDARKCIGCGRCYKICARDVLTLVEHGDLGMTDDDDPFGDDDDEDLDDDNSMVMSLKNRGDCIGCEACARICPKRCFTLASAPVAADLA